MLVILNGVCVNFFFGECVLNYYLFEEFVFKLMNIEFDFMCVCVNSY